MCVQEVAELKEEDLPSSTGVTIDPPIVTTAELPTHANAATELLIVPAPKGLIKLPTPASGVSGDLSKTLGKTDSNEGEISNFVDNLFLKFTGSNDLCDVLAEIHQLNNWKELGLQLGLLLPTLDRIERERQLRISECKIDMVSAWLQQQDNVSQKGLPSWSVLRAALKKIGENEMADKIVSEPNHVPWYFNTVCVYMCSLLLFQK